MQSYKELGRPAHEIMPSQRLRNVGDVFALRVHSVQKRTTQEGDAWTLLFRIENDMVTTAKDSFSTTLAAAWDREVGESQRKPMEE